MLAVDEMIVDSFAGGGGASEGIWMATGRHPDIAINHSPEALALHARNHPFTQHYQEDVWKVDPRVACAGRRVGLLYPRHDGPQPARRLVHRHARFHPSGCHQLDRSRAPHRGGAPLGVADGQGQWLPAPATRRRALARHGAPASRERLRRLMRAATASPAPRSARGRRRADDTPRRVGAPSAVDVRASREARPPAPRSARPAPECRIDNSASRVPAPDARSHRATAADRTP